MKRLVLALVSAALLAVFIAFNYLLWEREGREEKLHQLENNNASNNSSMNALSRENKKLETENDKLETDLSELKNLNISLQGDLQRLRDDKAAALNQVNSKNALLDALKGIVNVSTFEEMMKKWAESIDSKKYDEAYKLEYGWMAPEDRTMSLSDYSEKYKSTLKSLKLKSLKIETDKESTASGELSLLLVLDAKLLEDADATESNIVNGENKLRVKLKFLNEKEGFVIETISSTQ